MEKQIQDRYDELADQNEIGISYHVYHLLPGKGGEQEVCSSSHWEGPPAYRHWQRQRISMRQRYYSILCRIWQSQYFKIGGRFL